MSADRDAGADGRAPISPEDLISAILALWRRIDSLERLSFGRSEWSPELENLRERLGTFRHRLLQTADGEPRTGSGTTPTCGLIESGEETTLEECPIGLFRHGTTLALKTEYGTNEGRIDAYIVDTGEMFWGPAPQTIASQRACRVTPVTPACD